MVSLTILAVMLMVPVLIYAAPYSKLRPVTSSGTLSAVSGTTDTGFESVAITTGSYRLELSAAQIQQLIYVRVKVLNEGTAPLKVSPRMFYVQDSHGTVLRPLSPKVVMRIKWSQTGSVDGDIEAQRIWEKTVSSPAINFSGSQGSHDTSATTSVLDPNFSELQKGLAVAGAASPMLQNSRYGGDMKRDAEFLAKRTLFGVTLAPSNSIEGYLYFPKPADFPMDLHFGDMAPIHFIAVNGRWNDTLTLP
jgi:hypothetical protein